MLYYKKYLKYKIKYLNNKLYGGAEAELDELQLLIENTKNDPIILEQYKIMTTFFLDLIMKNIVYCSTDPNYITIKDTIVI